MNPTKNIILYGLLAGAVMNISWWIINPFLMNEDGTYDFSKGEIWGYVAMILALATVFIGMKNYRDKVHQGFVGFKPIFLFGLYTILITSVVYVVGWMIYYNFFMPDFPEQYLQYSIEQMKAAGVTGEELENQIAAMKSQMEWYKNPIVMIGLTFMEIFPVGLILVLIFAWILKRKKPA